MCAQRLPSTRLAVRCPLIGAPGAARWTVCQSGSRVPASGWLLRASTARAQPHHLPSTSPYRYRYSSRADRLISCSAGAAALRQFRFLAVKRRTRPTVPLCACASHASSAVIGSPRSCCSCPTGDTLVLRRRPMTSSILPPTFRLTSHIYARRRPCV